MGNLEEAEPLRAPEIFRTGHGRIGPAELLSDDRLEVLVDLSDRPPLRLHVRPESLPDTVLGEQPNGSIGAKHRR